jgi:hypothetical protein
MLTAEQHRLALFLPQHHPDDPDGRLALLHWLHNLVGHGGATYGLPTRDGLARLPMVQLEGLQAFWEEEGPTGLTTRMTGMLAGLARAGRSLLLVVDRDGPRFTWSIGFDDPQAALRPALVSSLPGSQVRALPGHDVLDRALAARGRLALAGIPPRTIAPKQEPLVERLAMTPIDRWSLIVVAEPVDPSALLIRYQSLVALRQAVARHVQMTRVIDERRSTQEVDPVAEQVTDLLKREERRMLTATRAGGFATQAWLLGDGPELSSIGVAAAAATVGEGATPRPMRVLAEGQGPDPTTTLLPEELAWLVQPPVHDLRGFPVRRWARFDVAAEPASHGGPTVHLGTTGDGDRVEYPVAALTTHALITGTTGSGKSTLLRGLLRDIAPTPYLVIEPTKDEYATLPVEGLQVWRIGAAGADGWALNPLEVPNGTPLQTHIDLLVALFGSTFALFPPLPYILEMGLRRVYEDQGWDLLSGRNALAEADPEVSPFPTLRDLQSTCLRLVRQLGYIGEVEHNVRGALQARLGSLLEGPKGALIDTDQRLDTGRLLGGPCVVNLDLVGNDREKAFFMGLLLIRIWEARRGTSSQDLVHLTVLEEAHRILPAPAASVATEGGEGDFAAETFTNLLAEVRAAGQGLLIVEQSPSRLADGAVTNTGLKIALRNMGPADRELLGAAMNMDEAQQQTLTSLDRHEAIAFWAGMDRPIRFTARRDVERRDHRPARSASGGGVRIPVDDAPVLRMADLLLRVGPVEAAALRGALDRRLMQVLPEPLQGRRRDVLVDVVRSAAESLGRSRRIGANGRAALATAALTNPPSGSPLPEPEHCACLGDGGLRLGRGHEVAQRAVDDWVGQGRHPSELTTFDKDATVLGILRARLEDAMGTDAAPQTRDATIPCLITLALRSSRPTREVEAFRTHVQTMIAGEAPHER